MELSGVNGILFSIKGLLERPSLEDAWLTTIKSLCLPNGPMAQFKSAMEQLTEKLESKTGIKRVIQPLVWSFHKGEVADILRTIERHKSLFVLALQKDHM